MDFVYFQRVLPHVCMHIVELISRRREGVLNYSDWDAVLVLHNLLSQQVSTKIAGSPLGGRALLSPLRRLPMP